MIFPSDIASFRGSGLQEHPCLILCVVPLREPPLDLADSVENNFN